jgi:hypothetical protein
MLDAEPGDVGLNGMRGLVYGAVSLLTLFGLWRVEVAESHGLISGYVGAA